MRASSALRVMSEGSIPSRSAAAFSSSTVGGSGMLSSMLCLAASSWTKATMAVDTAPTPGVLSSTALDQFGQRGDEVARPLEVEVQRILRTFAATAP
jgi:uncharacterized RmlC-like cupin family protein